ncbi:MAG: response regulator, partial [Smithellaceae bacterium]
NTSKDKPMTENAIHDSRPMILIVDDNATNIDLLVNTLKAENRLGIAKSGPKALDFAAKHKPDLVLLDIMMPGMDGYEVCKRLKADPRTDAIPVIFITAMSETTDKTRGFALGAVDYITKPFHAAEVIARVRTHLSLEEMRRQLTAHNLVLERKVEQKTTEIRNILNASIDAMTLMVEIRDPYTAGHQRRVADLARAIATEMNLSRDQIDGIRLAGMIHDIGKISIPSEILTKPTRLTQLEFELIKTHSESGYNILKDIEFPWPIARIVLEHHERMDGSGYPQGITGDDILLESKIIAVADVVEAISSHRPYRPAFGMNPALEEIIQGQGVIYDHAVVDACLKLFRENRYVLPV